MASAPDIFLSYEKSDKTRAMKLAEALEQNGWKVWWDHKIPPGRTWAEVIESSIKATRCVIVLWSRSSIKSEWVQKEARAAAKRKCLIPVLIDQVEPPFEFEHVQAADLTGWEGAQTGDFTDLIAELRDRLQSQPSQEIGAPEKKREEELERQRLTAEQARLEEERKQAAPENARLEQEERERKTAEGKKREEELERQRLAAEQERERKAAEEIDAPVERNASRAIENERRPAQPIVNSSRRGSLLFPLYGITLGKTTVSEIAARGSRAATIDDASGEPYLYYEVNGLDFWYDEESNIVDHMYITYTDPLPEPWKKLGFDWQKSYEQWLQLLQSLGYLTQITEEPHIQQWDGHDSFCAEIVARDPSLYVEEITLGFQFEPGTTRSRGTLYHMSIYVVDEEESDQDREVDADVDSSRRGSLLFPLYGITLGKTTVSEIAARGSRAATDDDSGEPYLYYEVNGLDFWYDEESNIVDSMYITYTHPLPEPWKKLGFDWQKSYEQWLQLLQSLGYLTQITEKPHIQQWDGHDSFCAEIVARDPSLYVEEITLGFQFKPGTTRSRGTLYRMSINVVDEEESDQDSEDDAAL